MSGKYILKISKPGKQVESTNIMDMQMTSEHNMLKFHSINDVTLTFHPGDTEQYTDIAHGLGYTPAFIPYAQDFNDATKLSFIGYSPPIDFGIASWSYSDSTKVRIGFYLINLIYNGDDSRLPRGFADPPTRDYYNNALGGVRGEIVVGNRFGGGVNGAFRISSVAVAQGATINTATLNFYVEFKGTGTGDMKIQTWGIAEDNTNDFSSDPTGRTKTSAVTTQNVSLGGTGSFFGINVTSQVQEIVNRAGWSSVNAMGFLISDNGSPVDVWVGDSGDGGSFSYLALNYGGDLTLKCRVIIFKDKIA